MPILVEYHQPAFRLLQEKLRNQTHALLVTDPSSIRAQHLLANLPVGEELPPERSWPVARSLLDVIEAEMARILRRRSMFFWLHVYRRIGVGLYSLHEDKTDPRTVGLVRQLVELAILKYGRVSDAREIVLSSRVNPDHILGGLMRAGVKQLAESQPSRTYREFAKAVKARPQWVIRDFAEEDFVDIHRVEGFAYQYWRVTALLRALGKDSRIKITPDGDWEYEIDSDLAWLLQSIDKRSENGSFDTSLLGTWIDGVERRSGEGEERPTFDHVICPIYNVSKVKISDSFKSLGLILGKDYVSNFVPVRINVRDFLRSHEFIAEAFRAKLGYGLEAFVAVLWAVANLMYLPDAYVEARSEAARRAMMQDNLLIAVQRGYRVFDIGTDRTIHQLRRRIQLFAPELDLSESEIRAILDRLTLTQQNQANISLWSGGPQYVLISAGMHHAVLLHGVPMMLATLFFRMAHDQGQRGTLFEEAFQRALTSRGFNLHRGELHALDGTQRELDAGVIVGNVLFAFECVSIERPLDYEIGHFPTFQRRQARLDDKVGQALSLGEFIKTKPRGTNYDFRHVEHVVPLVVSPFEEWIWDRSDRLWLADGTPRIVSAAEAIQLLEQALSGLGAEEAGAIAVNS